MVENSVKASGDLIEGAIRKFVSLGNSDVSAVVLNVLRTTEGVKLNESWWTAARYEGDGLVVAEAGKCLVLAGKIVIQANIKLAFIDLSHRGIAEVDA